MSISTPLYNQLFSLLSRPRQLLQEAKKQYYDAIWFSKIRELKCST